MVLIETVCQKTESETPRPRSQKFENPRRKETTQENEISRLIDPEFSGYHSPPLPLCFEKNMKTFFTHGLGKPASLGTLPLLKQKTTFPL